MHLLSNVLDSEKMHVSYHADEYFYFKANSFWKRSLNDGKYFFLKTKWLLFDPEN